MGRETPINTKEPPEKITSSAIDYTKAQWKIFYRLDRKRLEAQRHGTGARTYDRSLYCCINSRRVGRLRPSSAAGHPGK
jgi:hypothetical protein